MERVVYELPGPPPTGRKVQSHDGGVFQREHAHDEDYFGTWGRWVDQETGMSWNWLALLRQRGPLFLLELTDKEIEEERLYGPIGARWGFPDEPCPYRDHGRINPITSATVACTLGRGHIGPHLDENGIELGLDREFNPDKAADPSAVWCTCGNAGAHLPHCPRYKRLTGE